MSESEQGGRLTGGDIIDYIKETFDIEYHPGSVYKLLHRLGFSWITSRSRHPQQSQQVQENFKKTSC
jgi:transposase